MGKKNRNKNTSTNAQKEKVDDSIAKVEEEESLITESKSTEITQSEEIKEMGEGRQ